MKITPIANVGDRVTVPFDYAGPNGETIHVKGTVTVLCGRGYATVKCDEPRWGTHYWKLDDIETE